MLTWRVFAETVTYYKTLEFLPQHIVEIAHLDNFKHQLPFLMNINYLITTTYLIIFNSIANISLHQY